MSITEICFLIAATSAVMGIPIMAAGKRECDCKKKRQAYNLFVVCLTALVIGWAILDRI